MADITPIADIREADAVCDRVFELEAIITKKKAAQKKKIAALEKEFNDSIKDLVDEWTSLKEQLSVFDTDPKNEIYFTEPRKRKRPNGAHGLQTKTVLEYDAAIVTDEQKDTLAERESDRLKIELCTRKITRNEDLIRAALTAGEPIRGVRLVTKNVFQCPFKKSASKDTAEE